MHTHTHTHTHTTRNYSLILHYQHHCTVSGYHPHSKMNTHTHTHTHILVTYAHLHASDDHVVHKHECWQQLEIEKDAYAPRSIARSSIWCWQHLQQGEWKRLHVQFGWQERVGLCMLSTKFSREKRCHKLRSTKSKKAYSFGVFTTCGPRMTHRPRSRQPRPVEVDQCSQARNAVLFGQKTSTRNGPIEGSQAG